MATFKLAKKDAVSDTRTNIYDLHEKKLEYLEAEKKKLPDYLILLEKIKNKKYIDTTEKYKLNEQLNELEIKISNIKV